MSDLLKSALEDWMLPTAGVGVASGIGAGIGGVRDYRRGIGRGQQQAGDLMRQAKVDEYMQQLSGRLQGGRPATGGAAGAVSMALAQPSAQQALQKMQTQGQGAVPAARLAGPNMVRRMGRYGAIRGGLGGALLGGLSMAPLLASKFLSKQSGDPLAELFEQYKLAAQDNSQPPVSATGESKGLSFIDAGPQVYGREAWDLSKWGRKNYNKDANPFAGKHADDEAMNILEKLRQVELDKRLAMRDTAGRTGANVGGIGLALLGALGGGLLGRKLKVPLSLTDKGILGLGGAAKSLGGWRGLRDAGRASGVSLPNYATLKAREWIHTPVPGHTPREIASQLQAYPWGLGIAGAAAGGSAGNLFGGPLGQLTSGPSIPSQLRTPVTSDTMAQVQDILKPKTAVDDFALEFANFCADGAVLEKSAGRWDPWIQAGKSFFRPAAKPLVQAAKPAVQAAKPIATEAPGFAQRTLELAQRAGKPTAEVTGAGLRGAAGSFTAEGMGIPGTYELTNRTPILDPRTGQPMIDPKTGQPMTEKGLGFNLPGFVAGMATSPRFGRTAVGQTIKRPFANAFIGQSVGMGADELAGLAGVDTHGAGRMGGGWGGLAHGAGYNRFLNQRDVLVKARGTASKGIKTSPTPLFNIAEAAQQRAAIGNLNKGLIPQMQKGLEAVWEGGWAPLKAIGRVASKPFVNETPGWLKATTGLKGMPKVMHGVGATMAGVPMAIGVANMGLDAVGNRVRETGAELLGQGLPIAADFMEDRFNRIMEERGLLNQEGQFSPLNAILAQLGGGDPQAGMQKALMYGGGAMGAGGALTGHPLLGLAGLGTMAMSNPQMRQAMSSLTGYGGTGGPEGRNELSVQQEYARRSADQLAGREPLSR